MRIRAGRADLPPGAMRGHPAGPERFVLVANVGGTYFALDDWCNHAGCLLSNGELEGREVLCPCHGMAFDVRTGAATSLPRLCEDQRTYRIEVRDGDLWVEVD